MKVFVPVLCTLILILFFSACNDKNDRRILQYSSIRSVPGVTQNEIDAINRLRADVLDGRGYFTFGVLPSTEAFYNSEGEIKGFLALFCEWLTDLFEIPFKPQFVPWDEYLSSLTSMEVDFSGHLTATEERRKTWYMTSAIAMQTIQSYTLLGSPPLEYTALTRPLRYAFIRDTSTISEVTSNLEHDNYEIVIINNIDEVYAALKSGEADVFFSSNMVQASFDIYNDVTAKDFFPVIFSPVSLSTRNPALEPVISIVQKALDDGALRYLTTLYNRGNREYYRNKLFLQFNEQERAYIKNNPVVRYSAEYDNYPISFYNSHDKQWQGIAPDVLGEISSLTGISFERANHETNEYSLLLEMMENGEASFITELIHLPGREEYFIWPDTAMLTDNYALISKSSFPNIELNEILHIKAGLIRGTAHAVKFNSWFPDHADTAEFDSFHAAIDALNNNKVDMIMAGEHSLLMLTNYLEQPGFKTNIVFDSAFNSSFGINKNEEILCSIINKTLHFIDTNKIAGQWTRKIFDYSIKLAQSQLPYVIGFSFLLLSVLVMLLVLFRRTQSEEHRLDALVKTRTAELKDMQRELQAEAEKAQEANNAKSMFLAKMSHEIRTPMNAIIGMAELALRANTNPAAHEQIDTIKNSGEHLLSIINDILDISKIESGKLEISSSDYLFSSLINDVINIIKIRITDSQVHFVVNIDGNIPNNLYGDETRIRQVLLNILNNAVKYTEKGHISFTIAGNVVNDDTVFLTIEIADSGRGIKQENLIQIFNDFMQVDISYNKGIEGTGLGLPISKSLVMAMGGNIVVSSEYGSGSVFKITLPQKIRESGKLAQVENPGDKCVLVYERKEVYAHSIFRTIDNLGVGCTLVHNDADFENEISSGKYNFVLIASNLYNNTIDICKKFEKNIHIVLLVRDSGYSLDNLNLGILYMPVHSISIANMLNGIKGVYSDNTDAFSAVRFTAPEAKVLIVDDIYTNLKVAEGLLLPYQMRVDLCKSGREAVDMVKENNYDLILMDHMMPEMDGIEAAAHIRKWEQKQANSNSASGRNVGKKQIPIAALTANAVSGTREMFLENGFNDFLSKPINLVKLNSVLEKWIPKEKQKKYSGGNRNISSGLSAANNNNAQKTQLNLKIEGIDVEKGYTMLGSKLDSYLLVLSVFVKDSREKAQSVRECLKSGDIRLFTIHIHAIKSAAASIGAMELSNNAKALEEAAKQNDTSFIEQNTGNFLKEMETLLGNITKAIQDY